MELNEKDLELVRKPNFGHASTVRRDGAPSSAVVWIHERDGTVWFNSTSSSAKIKHLRRDPRAAISVHDQENPYVAVTFGRGGRGCRCADPQVHGYGTLP